MESLIALEIAVYNKVIPRPSDRPVTSVMSYRLMSDFELSYHKLISEAISLPLSYY